jgi:hypothetical protein
MTIRIRISVELWLLKVRILTPGHKTTRPSLRNPGYWPRILMLVNPISWVLADQLYHTVRTVAKYNKKNHKTEENWYPLCTFITPLPTGVYSHDKIIKKHLMSLYVIYIFTISLQYPTHKMSQNFNFRVLEIVFWIWISLLFSSVSYGLQYTQGLSFTFNNISVILWRSVFLVGGNGEKPRPVASHWQILLPNVVCEP